MHKRHSLHLAILLNFIQSRRRACPTASSGKESVSVTSGAGKGDEREKQCSEKFSQMHLHTYMYIVQQFSQTHPPHIKHYTSAQPESVSIPGEQVRRY